MYKELFSEGNIGDLKTKNRLVMSPMGCGMADLSGSPTEDMIAYYEARAKGGAGIVIPEFTRINDVHGVGLMRQLAVTKDRHIQPLSRLAQAVHKHGSKIVIQLHHPGRQTMSALIGGQPVVAPSAIMCKFVKQETRALTNAEVKELIQQYVDGAVRCHKAGCDGVMLHAAHGYLVGQFFSPYTNKRTDEYGGSYENRLRFAKEILEGIRREIGPDFPVGIRYSADEFLGSIGVTEPYIDPEEGIKIGVSLEEMGFDFLDVSCGIYESGIVSVEPISFQPGWKRDMIKAVKDQVSIPVIGVALIREPQMAEQFLNDKVLDFVSLGRPWLADEEWGEKVYTGREKELRKCVNCLRCFESLSTYGAMGQPLECAVNPRCARELQYGELEMATGGQTALVVGGGLAGLSAARTLALRNVKVKVIEKGPRLGGQINIGEKPPLKDRLDWAIQYYENEMERLGIPVELNTEATEETILSQKPDAVVIATGGVPIVPPIPGAEADNVYGVEDVLTGAIKFTGKSIALIGAGMTGIETAELLCAAGNQVTIVEMQDAIAPDGYATNVVDVKGRLDKYGAKYLLGHRLEEIKKDGIVVKDMANNKTQDLAVDAIVLSLGYLPNNALANALKDKLPQVQTVGDAAQVGRIGNAVRSGFEIGLNLFRQPERTPSFLSTTEDMQNFCKLSLMGDQKGLYLAYLTDPAAIAKILPPPLQPFSLPLVTLSVTHIKKPSFADHYYETILSVYATHKDKMGSYPIALLLGGPGAEMATQAGRDGCGLPKKLGAEFIIKKNDGVVTATVSRKGVQIIDAKVELGEYNNLMMGSLYQNPEAGKTTSGMAFYYQYNYGYGEEGKSFITNAQLVGNVCDYEYKAWEPGFGTLKLNASMDDPWGCLPVNTVIGAAFSQNDLYMRQMYLLDKPDTLSVLPYLLAARYDRTTFMETGEV